MTAKAHLHQSVDRSNFLLMNVIAPPPTATVGAYDAKTRLAELLDRVQKGEEIVITRHGKPIARLVPEGRATMEAAMAAIDGLATLGADLAQRGVGFSDEDIRIMRDDGRR